MPEQKWAGLTRAVEQYRKKRNRLATAGGEQTQPTQPPPSQPGGEQKQQPPPPPPPPPAPAPPPPPAPPSGEQQYVPSPPPPPVSAPSNRYTAPPPPPPAPQQPLYTKPMGSTPDFPLYTYPPFLLDMAWGLPSGDQEYVMPPMKLPATETTSLWDQRMNQQERFPGMGPYVPDALPLGKWDEQQVLPYKAEATTSQLDPTLEYLLQLLANGGPLGSQMGINTFDPNGVG